MKNIKSLIVKILILSLLFETQTNAGIEARKISAGDEAPWGGVIIPPEQFQFIDAELASCTYLKSHPEPCQQETDLKGMFTVGLFSFSIGALVGLFVIRK